MRPKLPIVIAIIFVVTGGAFISASPRQSAGAGTSHTAFLMVKSDSPTPVKISSNISLYCIPVRTHTTVAGAMEVYAATHPNFTYAGRESPTVGIFIEEINGRKNENGFSWTLFINNKPASKGVYAQVAPGDIVEWRYEKTNENVASRGPELSGL